MELLDRVLDPLASEGHVRRRAAMLAADLDPRKLGAPQQQVDRQHQVVRVDYASAIAVTIEEGRVVQWARVEVGHLLALLSLWPTSGVPAKSHRRRPFASPSRSCQAIDNALIISAIRQYVKMTCILRSVPRTRKTYIAPIDEKTIGRRLRELRRARGLTQVQVATALGINQSVVSDYENGTVRLHSALLAAFAKVLGASSDEILGLRAAQERDPVRDRRFLRRLEKIDRLPKRERQLLLGTIDAILKSAGVA